MADIWKIIKSFQFFLIFFSSLKIRRFKPLFLLGVITCTILMRKCRGGLHFALKWSVSLFMATPQLIFLIQFNLISVEWKIFCLISEMFRPCVVETLISLSWYCLYFLPSATVGDELNISLPHWREFLPRLTTDHFLKIAVLITDVIL